MTSKATTPAASRDSAALSVALDQSRDVKARVDSAADDLSKANDRVKGKIATCTFPSRVSIVPILCAVGDGYPKRLVTSICRDAHTHFVSAIDLSPSKCEHVVAPWPRRTGIELGVTTAH